MFVQYESEWANGTTDDFIEMIIEDNSPLCQELKHLWYNFDDNNTLNFTLDYDTLKIMMHNWFPTEGTNFSWRIVIYDTENTVEFPSGGGWITYNFTLPVYVNQFPNMTINYPTQTGYNLGQWLSDHELSVTINDAEGDNMYLYLDVYTIPYAYNMTNFPTYAERIVNNINLCDENIDRYSNYETDFVNEIPLTNDTYTFDMSWFCPYERQRYILALRLYDDMHDYWAPPVAQFIDVTVGVEDDYNKLAVRSLNAYDGSVTGASILEDGLNFYIAFDGKDYGDVTSDSRCTMTVFLTEKKSDSEKGLLEDEFKAEDDILIKSNLKIGNGLTSHAWQLVRFEPSFMRMCGVEKGREYTIYVGVLWKNLNLLTGLHDNDVVLYDVSASHPDYMNGLHYQNIYDDSMHMQEFRWECLNIGQGSYILTPPYNLAFGASEPYGDYTYIGFSSTFTTDTALLPAVQIVDVILLGTDMGIGGMNLILALGIIACFFIMPYILIKRKARNVPLPILLSFGSFGLMLSFGLGLLELWIIVLPFILFLFILIYRIMGSVWNSMPNKGGDEGVQ